LGGLFLGSTNPLFYELSAEMTFPVAEGSSAGVLTLLNNMAAIVVLFATPYFNPNSINTIVTISIICSGILLLLVREEYRRADLESIQTNTSLQ